MNVFVTKKYVVESEFVYMLNDIFVSKNEIIKYESDEWMN